ncbi:MAG: AAA family ATPase [Syntrophales bacterium]
MDYFKILNLSREPFSNSPEPEFFFPSQGHLTCLQQLELAIRLRRGLNVVMGDVGTGKTTLCRELILRFTEREEDRNEVETYLLLDPSCNTPREFLSAVAFAFGLAVMAAESDWQIKENIKNRLFFKGVEEKKTIVLIIDEGQKLPAFCREILREFLNYETNKYKLLQIVIFAQNEFREIMKEHVNFADRVNKYHLFGPLDFGETKAMIRFRLARAGRPADTPLFTFCGLWAIYRATGGYPRRIITLCHQVLLALIIQNKSKADWFLVRSVSRRLKPAFSRIPQLATAGLAAVLLIVFAAFWFLIPQWTINRYPASIPAVRTMPAPVKAASSGKESPPATPAGLVESLPEQTKGNPAVTDPMLLAKQAAPPTKPAPALAGKANLEQKAPDNLGRLNIRKGVTVIQLLRDVYGSSGPDRFQAIIEANPHIDDINIVRTGERIIFPAVPAATSWPQDGKLVRVANKTNLDEAYGYYKKCPVYVRMLPFWNPRDGMVFAFVLKKVFYSEKEARSAISNLPASLAAKAEIMEKPGEDTVYY